MYFNYISAFLSVFFIICIVFFGFILIFIIVHTIKSRIENNKSATDKNKSISDLSYQKYAKFYGEMAMADEHFNEKVNKIYNLIEKEKCEDLDFIAKESNCTFQECLLKIKYLKNKRVLGDYYIDNLSHTIKMCDAEDKKLLAKYSKFIYYHHMQIAEIAIKLPNASNANIEKLKKKVMEELKYLIDKSLINGVSINEVDGKLVYYTVEKHKKEKNIISIDCPHCGALNEVNRGSKVRCEYCNAIIEAPIK